MIGIIDVIFNVLKGIIKIFLFPVLTLPAIIIAGLYDIGKGSSDKLNLVFEKAEEYMMK